MCEAAASSEWEPDLDGDDHPEKGYQYWQKFGVPAAVEQRYSCGECIYLAFAMNERFGWPIKAQINTDDPSDEWIGHAYCVLPDGREIDILGPQDKVDHFESTVRDITAEELWDTISKSYHGNKAEIAAALEDARKAVDLFIAPAVRDL